MLHAMSLYPQFLLILLPHIRKKVVHHKQRFCSDPQLLYINTLAVWRVCRECSRQRSLPRCGIEAGTAAAVDFHRLILDLVSMSASRTRNLDDSARAAYSAAGFFQFFVVYGLNLFVIFHNLVPLLLRSSADLYGHLFYLAALFLSFL